MRTSAERRATFPIPTVAEVMRRRPITIDPDAPLGTALAVMAERGVRHLPVLGDDGRLMGMLTDRDGRGARPGARRRVPGALAPARRKFTKARRGAPGARRDDLGLRDDGSGRVVGAGGRDHAGWTLRRTPGSREWPSRRDAH